MKIKKSDLETLFNLTKGTEGVLNLSEARARDSFIKPLSDVTQSYYDQREAIYKHFCIKNEEGTPDLKDGNKYQFNPKQLDEINAELKTLGDEEVEVNFTDNPQLIKEILEKSAYTPKLMESEIIDNIINLI